MKTFILALGITVAVWTNAAAAGLTEEQKCAMKADLLAGKLSLCLSRADANVSKGKTDLTDAADLKCESKFRSNWGKTREKSQGKDPGLGPDCDGQMTDGVRDSVEASALIAAGRDLTIFQVNDADLADESGIQILIDNAVAGVDITLNDQSICENAGGIWEMDACAAAPTPESDNATVSEAVCTDVSGSWDGSTCTAAPVEETPNCFQSAYCWKADATWDTELPVSQSGPATQAECQASVGSAMWDQWEAGYDLAAGSGYLYQYCALGSDFDCFILEQMLSQCASS